MLVSKRRRLPPTPATRSKLLSLQPERPLHAKVYTAAPYTTSKTNEVERPDLDRLPLCSVHLTEGPGHQLDCFAC